MRATGFRDGSRPLPYWVLVRNDWHFAEGVDGRFHWRKVDSRGQVLMESATTFTFLSSCMKDARKNGFADEALDDR